MLDAALGGAGDREIDEAYHIACGVCYVKYGDYRLNPEHPPLVKLWVGSVIAATGFHLDPLRQFSDKPDERKFTQTLVFQKNDPDSVQRRVRAAIFVLSGLLLLSLTFALKHVFDARVALGALLFLVIDPTMAAHWPVVMTDLPVALLSATSILQKCAELDESVYFVHIELGNLQLKRGAREKALGEYSEALKYAPEDWLIRGPIEEQVKRMTVQPDGKIPLLRNPHME